MSSPNPIYYRQLVHPRNAGFTGRLVTRYLSMHPQRASFTFAIAARSESKLDALALSLSLDPSRVPAIRVDVTQADQLEAAVRMVKIVIDTVGPYWKHGTPVVKWVSLTRRFLCQRD